ncbi:MAG: phage holin family protein [Phototrophicaceae bacterium]
MRNFIIRVIINAIAIAVAAYLLPSIQVNNAIVPLLIVGAIITLANAVVKPILTLLTCPAVILTLGLFIFVINGLVLLVASNVAGNALVIDGFWAAFWGGIIMAIVNMFLEGIFGVREDDKKGKTKRD